MDKIAIAAVSENVHVSILLLNNLKTLYTGGVMFVVTTKLFLKNNDLNSVDSFFVVCT